MIIFKWFIWLLIGASVGILLAQDPGQAIFLYQGWLLEVPLLVALFFIFLLMGVCYLFFRTNDFVFGLPARIRHWFSRRKDRVAKRKTFRGLKVFLEGDYTRAEKILKDSAISETALLHYLFCARAAEELRATQRRDQYLKLATQTSPQSELAIGLTQSEFFFKQQQYDPCLLLLLRLQKHYPRHPIVIDRLMAVYEAQKDWPNLLEVIAVFSKLPGGDLSLTENRMVHAYERYLDDLWVKRDLAKAHLVWQEIPSKFQNELSLIKVYAKILMASHEFVLLEELIRNALSRGWDQTLVRLYGEIEWLKEAKQLAHAEAWLLSHPRDSELLLCLGRLCLRKQLWGKAKRYFETSLQILPTPKAYHDLACLLEAMGDKSAQDYFKKGLTLAAGEGEKPLPLPTRKE